MTSRVQALRRIQNGELGAPFFSTVGSELLKFLALILKPLICSAAAEKSHFVKNSAEILGGKQVVYFHGDELGCGFLCTMYGPPHECKGTLRTRKAVCVYLFGLQVESVLLAKMSSARACSN